MAIWMFFWQRIMMSSAYFFVFYSVEQRALPQTILIFSQMWESQLLMIMRYCYYQFYSSRKSTTLLKSKSQWIFFSDQVAFFVIVQTYWIISRVFLRPQLQKVSILRFTYQDWSETIFGPQLAAYFPFEYYWQKLISILRYFLRKVECTLREGSIFISV